VNYSNSKATIMDFKGSQFERDIIHWSVRRYVAYPISYRQLEEMMQERGVEVDHSSLNRWVLKFTPLLEQAFRKRKLAVGTSWRMDETYISVKGQWKYLYRAVDKAGYTIDFLLTAKRDRKAALRFLRKAIDQCGMPKKITIDALSLEQAVRRLTSDPADFYGIQDRGRLAPGLATDIAIFDPHTVGSANRGERRYDLPGGAKRMVMPSRGMLYTIVNGECVYADGNMTEARPGTVQRA
jgi:transposase-like protein